METLGYRAPDYGTLSPYTGDSRSSKAYFTYSSIATPPQTLAVDLNGYPEVTTLRSATVLFDAKKVEYDLRKYQSLMGRRYRYRS